MTELLLTDFPPGIPPADATLAVAIYHRLVEEYPGHRWQVSADHEAGVATVRLGYLDPLKIEHSLYGFVLHIDKLDPGLFGIVRAGGECLERYGLPRAKAGEDAGARALAHGLDVTAA
jgi:hypothetical protein